LRRAQNDVPLRGNAGDGKTFQQSKGLLQNIEGERR